MKNIILTFFLFMQFSTSFSQIEEVKDDYQWGKLENGQKTGVWQYFDEPGELSLRVNYTTGKLGYIKKDTSKYLVEVEGKWIESQITTPPHFLGSKKHVKDLISQNIGFPREARIRGIDGVTIVSANIDETGYFGNFEIIKELHGGCSKEAIRVLSEIPNTWVQATNTNGAIKSKIIFVFSFGYEEKYKISKSEMKKYPVLKEHKPYIIELKITALALNPPR